MTLNDSVENGVGALGFKDVDFIQIRYTDILGRFLAKYIAGDVGDGSEYIQNGIALDGSSVTGFTKINESDLLLIPDRSTLRLTPLSNYKVATVIADVYEGFGNGRLVRDPRYVSQACAKQALRSSALFLRTLSSARMEASKSNRQRALESTLSGESMAMMHLLSKTPYWSYGSKLPRC